MGFKIFSAVISITLLIGFVTPVVWKLKDPALTIIVLIGLTMMLVEVWQSLQSKDD